jgi:thioredoxin reductase (NADPH)
VVTAYDKQYKASGIILAYGKSPMDLNVPGELELKGKGVSYCANCDAPLYKNKTVAVAGIGDVAADAGLLLSKYAKKVYILSKSDKFVGHPALTKALFKKANVELVPFIQIQQILGENFIKGIQLMDLKSGKQRDLDLDGLFVELGYVVDSNFLQNIVELDEQQQIVVNPDQSTSCPGIFAAGDATNNLYKQAVISAGEGAAAALGCYDWLMKQKGGMGLTSDWTKIKKLK